MNSLQEEANKLESKLVEIRLSIEHPENRDKIFILLEGSTDIKLFRNIFSYNYTDSTEVNGKDKIIQALEILNNEGYLKLIGIKDADFDHLEEVSYPYNLFITDYHDMEVQMIESNALNSIIHEFTSQECHRNFLNNLKNQIYTLAIEIGYIRWYSDKIRVSMGKGLFDFKRIKFNNIISYSGCQVFLDMDELIRLLYVQIENNEVNIEENTALLKETSGDRLQICSGHDLTTLIANYFPTGNINQTKVEEALRLSYTMEYFRNTNLFSNLDIWANNHTHRLFD